MGDDAARGQRRGIGRHVAGDRLSAFLDDELADRDALDLTRHVLACPDCGDELQSLRTTRAALRELSPRPADPAPPRPVTAASRRPWVARAVCTSTVAVVLAVVGVVSYVAGDTGQVVPPVDAFLLDHLAHTGEGPVPAPLGGPAR